MTAILPLDVPPPDTLRQLREEIGLSQAELADELGFKESGADVIRAWERGDRGGKPCAPTPLAWRCFRMMVTMWRATQISRESGWLLVYDHLPERLK